MVKKYSELYLQTRQALAEPLGAQAPHYARQLLAAAAGKTVEEIVAGRDIFAPEQTEQTLHTMLERVLADEPLAYVLGEWDFYGMTLHVTPDVLIPRDDTVAVTELAIEQIVPMHRAPRILDLCAGSGCIGLAIARRIRDARVVLGEISPPALRVARKNAAALKLNGRVTCVSVDARQPAKPFLGQFDLIVSNPPYVTTAEMAQLPDSVAGFEPHLALHGGPDGLEFYRAIAENFTQVLQPGGCLCLEFGMGQETAVEQILLRHDYECDQWRKDASGITRAVCARRKEKKDV